jgi:hypothetical protein
MQQIADDRTEHRTSARNEIGFPVNSVHAISDIFHAISKIGKIAIVVVKVPAHGIEQGIEFPFHPAERAFNVLCHDEAPLLAASSRCG